MDDIIKNMYFDTEQQKDFFMKKTKLSLNNTETLLFDISNNEIIISKKMFNHILLLNNIKHNIITDVIIDDSPSNILIMLDYFMKFNYFTFAEILIKYLLKNNDFYKLFGMMKKNNTPENIIDKLVDSAKKTDEYILNYKNDYDFMLLYVYKNFNILPKINYIGFFHYDKFNPNFRQKNGNNVVEWLLNKNEQNIICEKNLYNALIILLSRDDYIFSQKMQEILNFIYKIMNYHDLNISTKELLKIIINKINDINELCYLCVDSQMSNKEKECILSLIFNDNRFDPNYKINNNNLFKLCINNTNCTNDLKLFFTKFIVNNKKDINLN